MFKIDDGVTMSVTIFFSRDDQLRETAATFSNKKKKRKSLHSTRATWYSVELCVYVCVCVRSRRKSRAPETSKPGPRPQNANEPPTATSTLGVLRPRLQGRSPRRRQPLMQNVEITRDLCA